MNDNTNTAWYALRRTLPPWSFEQNLDELITCLPKYKVDEVIVKLDCEDFFHGQPPLDWVEAYMPKLKQLKAEMDKLGIVFSLNPWITMGHCDRGRDSREALPGLRTMVGHDGNECKTCACPLSPVWRQHLKQIWSLYAETQPKVIWVEDDIRTFNHQPVTIGCFCPDHMAMFSERVGQEVTREEVVAAITQPGKPHPWRQEYLDMQGEIMIDTVSFIAKSVHEVSPSTSLGLMSSGPRTHCFEGRRWDEFCDALADGQPLYSRPPMSNYNEISLRGLYYSQDSIKLTRYAIPGDAIEQTEVENFPFSYYSKSVNFTFLQTALSFAYGSHGVTMNLFDHCGTPMEVEPGYGEMLGQRKDYLNGISQKLSKAGEFKGLRILHHPKTSYSKELSPDEGYHHLVESGFPMATIFETHGIPTCYTPSPVSATCGQVVRAMTDEAIKELLKGGLFLDGSAAKALFERGFGAEIGLSGIEAAQRLDDYTTCAAEGYHNTDFGGSDNTFMTLTLANFSQPVFNLLTPAAEAIEISAAVDPDRNRKLPLLIAYENELGGRVVISSLDWTHMHGESGFNNHFRKRQLQTVINWLAKDQFPLFIEGGVYPLTFRKDSDGEIIIGLFNLSLDDWPKAEFSLASAAAIESAGMLTETGEWQPDNRIKIADAGNGKLSVTFNDSISHLQPLFIALKTN